MNYRVRRWKSQDAKELKSLLNNIYVWEKLCDDVPFPYTDEDASAFIKKATKDDVAFDSYAIEVDHEICGGVKLKRLNPPHCIIYVMNFWVTPDYMEADALAEVLSDLTHHSFFHLPVTKIIARVHSDNSEAERVLLKAGYGKEATLKKTVLKSGKVLDTHIYACCEDMVNCI